MLKNHFLWFYIHTYLFIFICPIVEWGRGGVATDTRVLRWQGTRAGVAPAGTRRSPCPAVPRTPPLVIHYYVNCRLSPGQRLIISSPSHKTASWSTFLEPLRSHTPRGLPAPHPSASTGITENTVFTIDLFFAGPLRLRRFRSFESERLGIRCYHLAGHIN